MKYCKILSGLNLGLLEAKEKVLPMSDLVAINSSAQRLVFCFEILKYEIQIWKIGKVYIRIYIFEQWNPYVSFVYHPNFNYIRNNSQNWIECRTREKSYLKKQKHSRLSNIALLEEQLYFYCMLTTSCENRRHISSRVSKNGWQIRDQRHKSIIYIY